MAGRSIILQIPSNWSQQICLPRAFGNLNVGHEMIVKGYLQIWGMTYSILFTRTGDRKVVMNFSQAVIWERFPIFGNFVLQLLPLERNIFEGHIFRNGHEIGLDLRCGVREERYFVNLTHSQLQILTLPCSFNGRINAGTPPVIRLMTYQGTWEVAYNFVEQEGTIIFEASGWIQCCRENMFDAGTKIIFRCVIPGLLALTVYDQYGIEQYAVLGDVSDSSSSC